MDVAFLLILPLIGGYTFASKWNFVRYRTAREDGHRLYFRAALFAIILFFLALALHIILLYSFNTYAVLEQKISHGKLSSLYDLLLRHELLVENKSLNGNQTLSEFPIFLISLYAFALGLFLSYPLNGLFALVWVVFLRYKKFRNRQTKLLPLPPFLIEAMQQDDFEKLIVTAATRPMPLAITIESRKIYVGFVLETSSPRFSRKAITILPLMSGYRDEGSRVTFTTFYQPIYDVVKDDTHHLRHLSIDDFRVVLPVDRIITSNLFDLEAYEEFQRQSKAKLHQSSNPNQQQVPDNNS